MTMLGGRIHYIRSAASGTEQELKTYERKCENDTDSKE